jgi:hypothetical protein
LLHVLAQSLVQPSVSLGSHVSHFLVVVLHRPKVLLVHKPGEDLQSSKMHFGSP